MIFLELQEPHNKLIDVDIVNEMRKSFLDYSMSVIVAVRCPMCATD